MNRVWMALLLVATGVWPVAAATWEVAVPAKLSDNFVTAEFRLWIDNAHPATRPLRALLVLAPGWNGDGRGLVDDATWRAFARELGLGIVGVRLHSEEVEAPVSCHVVEQGGGAAWKRAVVRLAWESRRPEITKVPWLLWGHSAGGQFGYGLAFVYPESVAAFVAVKVGIYETKFDPRARGVPGLFVIGGNDEFWRGSRVTELFERERRHGAAWAVAWETGAGHEIGRNTELARAHLREAAGLRLSASPGAGMRRLRVGDGRVGDRARHEEAKERPAMAEARIRTVWLPGRETAAQWRRLGSGADTGAD